METFLHRTEAKKNGVLDFQREVVMPILASLGKNKLAKSLIEA